MKIFIYKTLFICVVFFLLFQFTIGAQIKKIEYQLNVLKSQENLFSIKEKIREELNNAILKDQYINKEDAILINKFIKKIREDLNNN
jgi:hypothetical protein|tara:strand:+ start:627 stop:887 length:261 start_codon:yes stop_codon:yes gene_type:complete